METVYLIIIFVAPGLIGRTLRDSFAKGRRTYANHYEYLTQVIIDSLVVNGTTFLCINILFEKISSTEELVNYLEQFTNCLNYVVLAGTLSILWAVLKNTWIAKAYLYIKNRILRRQKHTEHSLYTTDWDTMLHEEGIAGTWQVMSVYKDDKYIMSGMRHSSSTTNAEEFEIRLDRVELVEKLLREKPEMFVIKYAYYNTSTGLKVVVYDQQIFEEHWETKN